MKTISKILPVLVAVLLSFGFTACSSDDTLEKEPVEDSYIAKAKTLLNGEIVISTSSKLNDVDKTLLPGGCPAKYRFDWNGDNTMTLHLLGFQVGKMLFPIFFSCDCSFTKLSSFEEKEYRGDGWIKFTGGPGMLRTSEIGKASVQEGSSVTGYLNVNTQEIEFDVNYNMMNVHTNCPQQKIDKSRLARYEEELAQYEKDLKAYKVAHGLE